MPYPLGHGGSYETWVFRFYECPRQKGTIFHTREAPHNSAAACSNRYPFQVSPIP